jgi:hypothetical protein
MLRDVRPLLLLSILGTVSAQAACKRTPSEPAGASGDTDASVDAAAAVAAAKAGDQFHPTHKRDEKGNLVPRRPPPPLTDAEVFPVGKREPDWDLDPADPARSYVELYVQSTSRYGADTPCVHAAASKVEGGKTLVETRDGAGDDTHKCKGTNAVRDTFAVELDKDHLALADATRGKPLANWPDGSDPAGQPAPSPIEADLSTSPLREKLRAMQLVPLRLQRYGRGSYDVVSIAGWHADVAREASDATLDDAARRICAVTNGRPIGIFAGMDRETILRIRCNPNHGKFEKL